MINPVETHGLTKRYGSLRAVDELSISVPPGQVYGFLGPNGAGKTTTLRMLLGLVRPTSGRLRLLGKPPGHLDRVGALIEGPAFYPYLSGRDNLRVLADHAGVPRSRADGVLTKVDLTDRGGDRYSTYSLGMKQRLGLAAALLKEPDLLILDEPTNGLDPAGMADMRVTIRRLAANGCTVLLSSHLLAEVAQVCDWVGVLNKGRLVLQSSVAQLRAGGVVRVVARPADRAREHLVALLGTERVRAAVGHKGHAAVGHKGHAAVGHTAESPFAGTHAASGHTDGERSDGERSDGVPIDLDVPADRAAEINAELVRAGIEVSELSWQQPDLESTFLELTGGISDAH